MHAKLKLMGAGLMTAMALASTGATAAGEWEGAYAGIALSATSGEADWVFSNGNPANPKTQDLDTGVGVDLHAGYQMQFDSFVVGGEISGNWSNDVSGHAVCPNITVDCDVKGVDQLYLFNARLGFAPSSSWLVYLHGGYAYANVETSTKGGGFTAASTDEWHDGWAFGGGFEYALNQNFRIGLEYTRVDLSEETHKENIPLVTDNRHIDPELDVFKLRFSYAF